MLTSAVVFAVVVAAVCTTYGRLVWPMTYVVLFVAAVALFSWDLLPSADRAAKNAIILATFASTALLLINLVLVRRSSGWTR